MSKQPFIHGANQNLYVWARRLREYNEWYRHCKSLGIPFVHIHQQGRYCTIYCDGITVPERYWTWNDRQRDQYASLVHKALRIEPSDATRASVEAGLPVPGQVVQKEFILAVEGVLSREASEIANAISSLMLNVTRFSKKSAQAS